jgi:transposase
VKGQLTSEHTRLIVPDKQMLRLDNPLDSATDLILPHNSHNVSHSSVVPEILIPRLRGKLFFFDEANLSWCPESGRIYRVSGSEYKVNTPGRNQRMYILGSLEYPSGGGLYEIYPHKRHEEFQAHLEHLMDMYPKDYLFLVRDNATSHVTPKLDTFLRSAKDKLCLVPLPTYSPHLNLIERLWHYMRDNMTRSYFYVKLREQCEAIVEWLETLPIERFLSLMGLSP